MKIKPNQLGQLDITSARKKWEKALKKHINQNTVSGRWSKETLKSRGYILSTLAEWMSYGLILPDEVQEEDMIEYFKRGLSHVKDNTRAKNAVIYRLFFDSVKSKNGNPMDFMKGVRQKKNPESDYLTEDELNHIMDVVINNDDFYPKKHEKDVLLFMLLIKLCMRVSEITSLKVDDVKLDPSGGGKIWVTRKGGRKVTLPINESIAKSISKVTHGKKGDEPIFHGKRDKKGNLLPMTRQGVYKIVSYYLDKAGIQKEKSGPHLLRHSGASLKVKKGANLVAVQRLLGHSNLKTTMQYLHVGNDDMMEIVDI